MPIDDIISSLKQESKQELKNLQEEKKQKFQNLKEEYNKKVQVKKDQVQESLEQEFESRRHSLEQKIRSKRQKEVLVRKRELLKKLKEQIREKLKNLGSESHKKLLSHLIKKIPVQKGGVLQADKESLPLLKDVIKKREGIRISEEPLSSEGLYFSTSDMELDLTFDHLVDVVFENNEDNLNKILFTR